MDDALFSDNVLQDSPRLAWMKKHGIVLWRHECAGEDYPQLWLAGFQSWHPEHTDPADFFFWETGANGDSRMAEGATEEEALGILASRYELPHWAA